MPALGFDPDVHGWMKLMPLHWAACRGNPLLIRALLARGARIEDLGRDFGTPLHTALHCRWQRGREGDMWRETTIRAACPTFSRSTETPVAGDGH